MTYINTSATRSVAASMKCSSWRCVFNRASFVARSIPWIAAICLWAIAVNAGSQTPTGQQDFQHYCAICHGPKGNGKGEAAYTLSGTYPPDLTQLSRRNGGKFPFEDVYEIVDGRKEFPSHERLNMPFFGTELEMEQGETAEGKAKTEARIRAIVHYIETLQQE
jgi:mono/diheme cytochrome c family protein